MIAFGNVVIIPKIYTADGWKLISERLFTGVWNKIAYSFANFCVITDACTLGDSISISVHNSVAPIETI